MLLNIAGRNFTIIHELSGHQATTRPRLVTECLRLFARRLKHLPFPGLVHILIPLAFSSWLDQEKGGREGQLVF